MSVPRIIHQTASRNGVTPVTSLEHVVVVPATERSKDSTVPRMDGTGPGPVRTAGKLADRAPSVQRIIQRAEIDRLVHEPVRLGLLCLLTHGPLSWLDARAALETSDGNLSVHARRLEDAGYVLQRKFFLGRRPRTELEITDRGRAALLAYGDVMVSLLTEARP